MIRGSTRVIVEPRDEILGKYTDLLRQLADGKARVAMARAVNYGGARANTQVIRSLVRQTSIPRGVVVGSLRQIKASTSAKSSGAIEYVIVARGRELPLRDFNPIQFRAGTRAKVWGRLQTFKSAFIFAGHPGSGQEVGGGHVFVRTGGFNAKSGRNNAFEKMYGPSIPKEIVQGETAVAFAKVSKEATDRRLFHELKRMLQF